MLVRELLDKVYYWYRSDEGYRVSIEAYQRMAPLSRQDAQSSVCVLSISLRGLDSKRFLWNTRYETIRSWLASSVIPWSVERRFFLIKHRLSGFYCL